MEELKAYLKAIQGMPPKSKRRCNAVVIPSGYSAEQVQAIEKMIDDLGLARIPFRSVEDLEKRPLEGQSPICLITDDQCRTVSLSIFFDLVFQFPNS